MHIPSRSITLIAWLILPTCLANAAHPELSAIEKKYAIGIETLDAKFPVRTAHGLIEGRPPAPAALSRYVPVFDREFRRYPTSLIRVVHLKRVVLCQDLKYAGQRRTAVPDFEHDTLYLDVARGSHDRRYARAVIHHEFFHMIDLRDDGKVYKDPDWASLNDDSFRYGTGGVNSQDNPSSSLLTKRYPGFLNHYSTTGVEEDKAEIFAYLLVKPSYVEQRAKADATLLSKVQRMKQMMARFCPEADAAFWTTATRGP